MAVYNVACCYRRGDGVKKDAVKAAEWYERAAALGVSDAMIGLGYLYGRGKGVKVDGDTLHGKFARNNQTKKLLKDYAPIVKIS